jgi:plasmid stabilization system protein ParE
MIDLKITSVARYNMSRIAYHLRSSLPNGNEGEIDYADRIIEQEVGKIEDCFDRLLRFPLSGRTGRIPGTREVAVPDAPYVILYRPPGRYRRVTILGVRHGAQRPISSLSRVRPESPGTDFK